MVSHFSSLSYVPSLSSPPPLVAPSLPPVFFAGTLSPLVPLSLPLVVEFTTSREDRREGGGIGHSVAPSPSLGRFKRYLNTLTLVPMDWGKLGRSLILRRLKIHSPIRIYSY